MSDNSNFLSNIYLRSVESCVLCRSRRERSNETLITKFGIDTAENVPIENLGCLPAPDLSLDRLNSCAYRSGPGIGSSTWVLALRNFIPISSSAYRGSVNR